MAMKPTRRLFSALLVGTAAVVLGCGERAPTATDLPALQASNFHSSRGLLPCKPLAYDSVTQTVGWKGGVLRVSHHALSIPVGALSRPVKITLVAPRDTLRRIEARPEGLVFEHPVELTLSYAKCDDFTQPKRVAYVNGSLEILEYVPSVDDVSGRKVTGQLSHFSQWAVSW